LQSDAQVGREATNLSLQITHFETEIPHLRRRLRRRMTVVPFSPPRLVIRAFDKEQVEIEGRLIAKSDWQSPKAPILLFLLLAYPSGLTKEEIGVHLWPDHEPEKFKGNFQKTIYRLRRATKQNIVLYNEETERYSFNWQLDYWYDVIAFRKALDQAKTEGEAAAQISAYRAALELYDGSYLPHIEGLWVWPLRQSLDGLFREASLQAAKLCLVGGEYEKTIHICRRLLTEDRSCEDAHRLLMRAHAAKGNIAAVKRQFADCQDVLRRDLQVAPSPRTIELYEMLTHAIRL
jgi:DNA-binding SARP family transcriptional activator